MENQHPDFLMGVSENLFITIGKVNIQNFHVTVGGIIPKLNGEFAENMNAKVSTHGVTSIAMSNRLSLI